MSATSNPYRKAFAFAAVFFVLGVIALFARYGSPGPDAVQAMTYMVLAVLVPAWITGWQVKRSSKVWPLWKIGLLYVGVLVVLAIVLASGRMH